MLYIISLSYTNSTKLAICRSSYAMDDAIFKANNIRPDAPYKFLIIGAGSRGNGYARALTQSTPEAQITAIAEPIASKRRSFGQKYIWANQEPTPSQSFEDWRDVLKLTEAYKEQGPEAAREMPEIDALFICTLDETHVEIISAFAPLGYHIMSEKPLATTLQDCIKIYGSLKPPDTTTPTSVFSIGHVLHYSPHNMLLRKMLLEEEVIGDIISMEHTEPVGWWHFAHSYVRGNWRKESISAPSLLTKSCHDVDLILWLLCSPPASAASQDLHLPCDVVSTGSLFYFKPSRKPAAAGNATNCYHCPAEPDCIYSAKKIYVRDQLAQGNSNWPVVIIDPEIEDFYLAGNHAAAFKRLDERLREDYTGPKPPSSDRSWYGRCVYEADNDVCDDQTVTMTWQEEPLSTALDRPMQDRIHGKGAKTATLRMVAWTEKQCDRRGRVYGTKGEIEYDSKTIRVYNFDSKKAQTHHPHQPDGGHGGGDQGLAMAFFNAVKAVKLQTMDVQEAQRVHIGCTLDDIIRSHAMIFAAEESRKRKRTVEWPEWWRANVETMIRRGRSQADPEVART